MVARDQSAAGRPSEPTATASPMPPLGLDMTQWWQARSAGYFRYVPKARILEEVRELLAAGGPEPALSP